MKLDFPIEISNHKNIYCIFCHSIDIASTKSKGVTKYFCHSCSTHSDRAIIIDPEIIWWIDPKTNDYWHASVGIFIFNDEGKFLIFKLQKYPYKYTIPAGHFNLNETPLDAARREAIEETSLVISKLKLCGEDDISGDSCGRGSDHHRWNTVHAIAIDTDSLNINNEGIEPIWVTPQEAVQFDFTVPVQFIFDKYKAIFISK